MRGRNCGTKMMAIEQPAIATTAEHKKKIVPSSFFVFCNALCSTCHQKVTAAMEMMENSAVEIPFMQKRANPERNRDGKWEMGYENWTIESVSIIHFVRKSIWGEVTSEENNCSLIQAM